MSHEDVRSLKDVESLEQAYQELAVQAHLLKNEAKDRWASLKADWVHLQRELEPARGAGHHAAQEIGSAASLLAGSVRDGLAELRRSLPGSH